LPASAIRVVIRGRVQGVGFRAFVVDTASSLGITGFVRNVEYGGGLEVVARGDASTLDRLVEELRTGPPGAHVADITTQEIEPASTYDGFTIRY
jgi:acylphosphatase